VWDRRVLVFSYIEIYTHRIEIYKKIMDWKKCKKRVALKISKKIIDTYKENRVA
jgi:hypothetical protein